MKLSCKIPLILALTVFTTVNCSNQWREGDADLTAEEMMAMLDEVSAAQGQALAGGSVNEALLLKEDPNVRIYFADGYDKSPMGPASSVTSLVSFDFLGAGPDYHWLSITESRVFFFDVPTDSGRSNGLILGLKKNGEGAFSYFGFVGSGSISDEEMVVTLQSNGQDKLVLRSYDVADGDLAETIQIKVWELDGMGNEVYIGKFSTLVGFGQ